MAKRRSNYYGAASTPEVETVSNTVEATENTVVEPAPVAVEPTSTPEVVEPAPASVVEPTPEPAPEVKPVPAPEVKPAPAPEVKPAPVVNPAPAKAEVKVPVVKVRYGARFNHPQYGVVQVVTVPVNGHCMIRIEATGKSVPYTVK